jgi:hypothetical protein
MLVIICILADPKIAQNGIVVICNLYDIRDNSRIAKPNPKLVPKTEVCPIDDGIIEVYRFAYCLRKIYFDNSSIIAAPKKTKKSGRDKTFVKIKISMTSAKLAERTPNNKLVMKSIYYLSNTI